MVKIIENYTLHEQIGEGQYGKVFRGIDSRTKREVAVKVINVKKFKEYPKLEECTLNEIEVLSNIDSPHVVKFIEILKTANNFYFFYEFCNEGTLEDLIKSKGTLSEREALEYLSQILEAFHILSSKHIMHRDLKPSNILVSNGVIKLADFGFCKSLESHRDLAQTMLGSPIYMAPQVLKGEIYTIKADIWSLGVVIYEMLYGFCPFEERSIARLINLLDTEQVAFNSQINKISPDFQVLIKRMLVKDHFKRINWDQIFSAKVNGVPILKSNKKKSVNIEIPCQKYPITNGYMSRNDELYNIPFIKTISTEPEDKKQRKDTSYERYDQYKNAEPIKNELREIKNYENSRNPQEYNYFSRSNDNSHKKSEAIEQNNLSIPSMFKKKSSTHNGINSNKQNLKMTPIQTDSINSNSIRNRIFYYLKTVNDIVKWNICPDITAQLCLKIYLLLQKEHNKLCDSDWSSQMRTEREALSQAIEIFKEESSKAESGVNGPLLTHYIKVVQGASKTTNETASKQLCSHCLHLLDLNEFSVRTKINDYSLYSKQKVATEIHQKIIRNVI